MIEIEESTGNVYADLDLPDAHEMFVKAQLAVRLNQAIEAHHWTHQIAAGELNISQSTISHVMCGEFRGISRANMLEWVARAEAAFAR
jgi:predicted XRE-type DNA-binding protein